MASAPIKPTSEQAVILNRLAVRPLPIEEIEDLETLKVLIAWGWAFERAGMVQITGSGAYHVGGARGGILGGL
jgi:hypothetical protein